jgi:GT2 family glycosyltransferase
MGAYFKMDVSIVIVAWNVKNLLRDCLKSVFEQTHGIEFEVIYVDNASSDGSIEMVTKEFPEVRVIKNTENKGFIKANNQGIEVAEGRYVLLLNSDTIVLDNAIKKTAKFADKHPEAAVVGCRVLNPDRSLQRNCFMYPSLLNMLLAATYLYKIFPKSRFFGREYMTWWNLNNVREVQTVAGCYSLVRMEAIRQVGLMDELYFVYGDDPDWCYRFSKNGWKIIFTPDAEIIHYGGQNTKQMAREFRWQLDGSRLIFMKLHKSEIEFVAARLLTALFSFLRIPYHLGKGVFTKTKRKPSFETAKTYWLSAYYCLVDWTRLLMNAEVVKMKLHVMPANRDLQKPLRNT